MCEYVTHPEHWPGDQGDVVAALGDQCRRGTHPEHWPGDAGAVAESLAPFAVAAVASEVVLRQIAEMLHIDYDALPTQDFLGGIHPAAKVIADVR